MKDKLITQITTDMANHLSTQQLENLQKVLMAAFINVEIAEIKTVNKQKSNEKLLELFISAKRIEGCSEKSLKYYRMVIENMFTSLNLIVRDIATSDLRTYLAHYQRERKSSKVTIDNMRRIFSSFFKKENSKEEAKNRLKLVLIQDRAMLPSGVLDNMKDDILKVLSKYVEIEKSKLNIEVCPYDDDPRKIALVANIPILKSSNREVTKTTKQKHK